MRIVVDPEELTRFAAFAVEAADDHAARAGRIASLDIPAMPAEVASVVTAALAGVADDLTALSASLYGEALLLRLRASVLDPMVNRHLMGGLPSPPG